MNQRHRDSSARLLGELEAFSELRPLRRRVGPGTWTSAVLDEISEYERTHGARVRPDGKLLRTVNFDMMIGNRSRSPVIMVRLLKMSPRLFGRT